MLAPERQVECTIPVLPVRDLSRSITFYTGTLGFNLDWGGPDKIICSVSRDQCHIMLMQTEQTRSPVWVWIGLEDESLFEQYRAAGVKVFQEPRNYPWAYEMKFEDPDGNILWLGTETKKNLPLEGGPTA